MGKKDKEVINNKNNIMYDLSKYSDDEIVTMPAEFAKALMKQSLYNTKKNTSANTSKTYSLYTREQISNWLKSPSSNEKNLRNASQYIYLTSMPYQRLIKYYSTIFDWVYIVVPLQFNETKAKKSKKEDNFEKQFQRINQFLDNVKIASKMREVMKIVLKEGVFYGVIEYDNDSAIIKKINPDYCKITSVVDDVYLYSVDMSQISEDKLEFYPEIFTELKEKYKKTGERYQEIPMENSFCIKADHDVETYSIPPFSSTMLSLYTIRNREELIDTQDEIQNYKMIAGNIQLDKNGVPTMGWDTFLKYYNHIENAISDKIGLAISPFDLKSFDFNDSDNVSDVDKVSQAVNNYWTNSGTSGLLHGVSNSTAGVTKLAIKNDESYVTEVVDQIQNQINLYLKTMFSRSLRFKVEFLPITIYNKSDYIELYKSSVAFGIGKSHYIASLGIKQGDVYGLSYLEDKVMKLDNLKPLINSHNASAEELSGNRGRNEMDEEDLSESGESTRENDTNENR